MEPRCHRLQIPSIFVFDSDSFPGLHSMALSQHPICHLLCLVSKVGYELSKVNLNNSTVALKESSSTLSMHSYLKQEEGTRGPLIFDPGTEGDASGWLNRVPTVSKISLG